MCLYGVYKWVNIINKNQKNTRVKVDACIADEIQWLNDCGIITLGCCCGHGEAGKERKWENMSGKWKMRSNPPEALIEKGSSEKARMFGYRPIPFYYSDGNARGIMNMVLKTGCITYEDCEEWHDENKLPFIKHLGIIAENREAPRYNIP